MEKAVLGRRGSMATLADSVSSRENGRHPRNYWLRGTNRNKAPAKSAPRRVVPGLRTKVGGKNPRPHGGSMMLHSLRRIFTPLQYFSDQPFHSTGTCTIGVRNSYGVRAVACSRSEFEPNGFWLVASRHVSGECRDLCRETISKSIAMATSEPTVLVKVCAYICFVMSNFAQSFTPLLPSPCWLLTEALWVRVLPVEPIPFPPLICMPVC